VADVVGRAVDIILTHQAATGAYPACPTFAPYRYCWLRDGSFVADAMSRAGEVASAEAFLDWCARAIEERRGEGLHARYTLDGRESDEEWPTFQLDGYGLWLWAFSEHCTRHRRPSGRWTLAADLTQRFLRRHWREPCVDWWEERTGIHPATLGCLWLGARTVDDDLAARIAQELRAIAQPRLDASLLVLLPPFGPLDAEPLLARIEGELVSPGGGVHRHLDDVYYGGGEWVLLTAMLGSVYAALGRTDDAQAKLEWIAARAGPDGTLPEQVDDHLLHPEMRSAWIEKWGPPATPLLWSHAMALRLALDLRV
jgi:isomaltose glucohydrolase